MPSFLSPEAERARKRQAIGLAARRPTARPIVYLPPDRYPGEGRLWFAVLLLIAIVLATLWMLYESLQPELQTSLAGRLDIQLLLEDDFSSPKLPLDDSQVEGVWKTGFTGGVYQIRIDRPGHLIWSTLGLLNLNTYRVETELTLLNPTSPELAEKAAWGYGGLVVRYGNEENFYLFVIDGRGTYQIQLQQDGVWRILVPWTASDVLRGLGETNQLAVEDDGSQTRFYANNHLLTTVTEPRLPSGDVGLAAGMRSEGSLSAHFDWVKIYRIPVHP